MEQIFKARTNIKNGIFINGEHIDSMFKTFQSDILLQGCLANSKVEVELYDGVSFNPLHSTEAVSPVREAPSMFDAMTRAELKVYLIDKGIDRRELNDLSKSDLIALARSQE